jgi:predicted DNA-binding ribbon-helix-helix protein
MKSPVVKRSIVIAGHKTSVSLEDAFWKGLKDIAAARDTTLSDLVAAIDTTRRRGNLSSAIRLFVLEHFQTQGDGRSAGEHGTSQHSGSSQAHPVMVLAPAATPSILRPE